MSSILEQLRSRRRQKPFVPFVIVLSDGRRIPITRPLQYAFHEERVVVLDEQDRITRFTPADIIDFEELHPVS